MSPPDTATHRLVNAFSISALLLAIAPVAWAAPFAYIANNTDNTVSVIDIATNTVTATIPVGKGPFGAAVTPDGSKVYVPNKSDGTVSVIDAATNTVTATVSLGTNPDTTAVTPDGSKVYVTTTNGVSVVDVATNSITTTIPVVGQRVVVSPDGSKAYVTSLGGNNSVSVIDTATNAVTTTISVGTAPRGIAVTPDNSKVYVANYGGSSVSVIDAATNAVTSTVAVGSGPSNVAVTPDGSSVYVTNSNSKTISVIEVATNTVTATVTVGFGPYGVAVTPSGSIVYVTNEGDNTVSVIATATNTLTATIAVGNSPYSVGQFIGKGLQTIGFTSTAPGGASVGGATYTPTATATSGLAVALTIDASASAVCAISSGVVVFTGVGVCVIDANQAGNTSYGAASQVQQSFGVSAANPTLNGAAVPGSTKFGSAIGDGATLAGGGNPTGTLTFSLFGAGDTTCSAAPLFTSTVTVAGNGSYSSTTFTPGATGTYKWTVAYSGDANNAAANVACGASNQSADITPADQAIVFDAAPSVIVGGSGVVTATGGASGNPVLFGTTSAANICTVSATGTVTGAGTGNCVVTADQAGNANFTAAPQATQMVTIGQGSQTIAFTSTPTGNANVDGSYVVSATATSGLPVVFSIDATSTANACTISGSTVSFTGAGTCVIDADQSGDANYTAAPRVQQIVAIAAPLVLVPTPMLSTQLLALLAGLLGALGLARTRRA